MIVFLSALGAANAAEPGWYIGIDGGVTINSDATTIVGSPSTSVDYNTGYGLGGVIGRGFSFGSGGSLLRVEAEVGYRRNSISDTSVAPLIEPGQTKSITALANLIVEFPVSEKVTLTIGGGAGITSVDTDLVLNLFFIQENLIEIVPGTPTSAHVKETLFAGQFQAGAGYRVSENATVSLDFKYFLSGSPSGLGVKVKNSGIFLGARRTF